MCRCVSPFDLRAFGLRPLISFSGIRPMANAFDPYREALVVEANTIWPEEFADLTPGEKAYLEVKLHETPKDAADLDYSRLHTGFARDITVTAADLARVKK